jgi:hypothetical protein
VANKTIPELTERQLRNFWLKVDKRAPDECWKWLASRCWCGYGRLALTPRGLFNAPRVAYYLATGKQPGPLCVCHTCDTPACCNPAHLFLGTHTDNMADKVAKGRAKGRLLRGVSNGAAKLTEAQVLAIRASTATGTVLATKYSVSEGMISLIKSRKSWKHI